MPARIALILLCLCLCSGISRAQQGATGTAFDNAIELPIYGRMIGAIWNGTLDLFSENYGQQIYPLGDIDHDGLSDWILKHDRTDSVQYNPETGYSSIPEELLLYKGTRGRLPAVESGVRIGPAEVYARTDFFCSGDFDADGNTDLVVSISVFRDTSDGKPLETGADLSSVVVFWGHPGGEYSLTDTSRLMCDSTRWLLPTTGVAGRLSEGEADDLVVYSAFGRGFAGGRETKVPGLTIFDGVAGSRWGRELPAVPSMRLWNYPRYIGHVLKIQDHDGDGLLDIINTGRAIPKRPTIAVLYGSRATNFFDTLQLDSVNIDTADGLTPCYIDVTGDSLPELVVTCKSANETKIYAGAPGQRIKEQFGSGNDTPMADRGWWYRPWATVWEPARIDPDEEWVQGRMADAGDGNRDGIRDIWLLPTNMLVCYTTGAGLDSSADAYVVQPGAFNATNLGDIDGSGVESIAISYNRQAYVNNIFPGALAFIKCSRKIPSGEQKRLLPNNPTVSVSRDVYTGEPIRLTIERTAAGIIVRGDAGSFHQIQVATIDGREVLARTVPPAASTTNIGNLPRGRYLISTVSDRKQRTTVLISVE